MRPSVAVEAVRAQRRSLLVSAVSLAALIGMYMAVWPSVKGTGSSFSKLIDEMPNAYKALFTSGTGIDFSTPAGYLNVELFGFMAPIVVLVYAIGTGAAAIAGEEDRHTIDLLLVNRVSRGRVVVEKIAALIFGTVVLAGAMWVALLVEGPIAGMDVPIANSAAAFAHLALLGIEFGALAVLAGARTGRLGLSRAVPAMAAACLYVVNALGTLVDWLKPLRPVSPFFQYSGHDPLRTGASPTAVVVAVASTFVLVAAAVRVFRCRDVGA
jgi:ABC-2 type transport system permease protein